MKPIMLVLSSSLLFAASGALAQSPSQGDACSNQYGACMDRCASRPQSTQAQCSQNCENTTNMCYVNMYGKPPAPGTGQSQASVPAPAAPAPEARHARGEAKRTK